MTIHVGQIFEKKIGGTKAAFGTDIFGEPIFAPDGQTWQYVGLELRFADYLTAQTTVLANSASYAGKTIAVMSGGKYEMYYVESAATGTLVKIQTEIAAHPPLGFTADDLVDYVYYAVSTVPPVAIETAAGERYPVRQNAPVSGKYPVNIGAELAAAMGSATWKIIFE